MIKAKVDGRPVEIETSYSELTFGKYIKITEMGLRGDKVEVKRSDILAVMLGIPVETVRKAKFSGLDPVLKALSFVFDTTPRIEEFPTRVGEYKIPKDITNYSVEQFETMAKYAQNAAKPEVSIIDKLKMNAMYCAIYCQPLNGEDFDEEKAQWLAEKFLSYPCEEVMSAGLFFMLNYRSLKENLPMSYLYRNIPLKRKRPGLDAFLRRSGFTALSTRWQGIWGAVTRKR